MDLRSYLRAIRKGWVLILIGVLLGVGLGFAMIARATPIYASHMTFYVSIRSTTANTTTTALSTDQFAQQRANSYAKLLSSQRLGQMVAANNSSLGLNAGGVASKVSGTAELNTVLIYATVRDTLPERAYAIMHAVGTEFPVMIDQLDNTLKGNDVKLQVVSGPTKPTVPISPRKTLDLALGLFAGILLGLLAAVLREVMDTSIRTTEALQAVTAGAPVLGTVPFDAGARRAPLVVGAQGRSVRAEAYRQLRTNLQFIDIANRADVIVVTSARAGEGKSTTSANLALVVAESNRRVLLLEADLRRPRITEYLGMERSVGLTNVLAGQVALDDALQVWGERGLVVLPSGSLPPNPSELLGSESMARVIQQLRDRFDTIIIDTPPLLPVTDAAVAARLADGVLLVVRHGKTTRAQVTNAARLLEPVGARLIGTVLNLRPSKGAGYAGRYDGYGYYEDGPDAGPTLKDAAAERAAGHKRRRRSSSSARQIEPPMAPVETTDVTSEVGTVAASIRTRAAATFHGPGRANQPLHRAEPGRGARPDESPREADSTAGRSR
jgi:succinoglycan biosynthesis transport protein ExoP